MADIKPLSAEDTARLRAAHGEHDTGLAEYGTVYPSLSVCGDGDGDYPCDTARLLATLDAERARADEAVALLRDMDAPWLIAFAITEAEMGAQSARLRHRAEYMARADRYRAMFPRLDALLGNASNGSTDA